jgi:hypothetical protein
MRSLSISPSCRKCSNSASTQWATDNLMAPWTRAGEGEVNDTHERLWHAPGSASTASCARSLHERLARCVKSRDALRRSPSRGGVRPQNCSLRDSFSEGADGVAEALTGPGSISPRSPAWAIIMTTSSTSPRTLLGGSTRFARTPASGAARPPRRGSFERAGADRGIALLRRAATR